MPTPLRAGLVLLVLASPAFSQTISLDFGGFGAGGAVTSLPFSQQSCLDGNQYIIQWTASGLGGACSDMQIFVTSSQSCPIAPSTSVSDGGTPADVILETVSTSDLQTGSGQVASKRLRDMPSLGGSCPDGQDLTNAICAFVRYRPSTTNCDGTIGSSTNLTLHYDAKPPVPPSMEVFGQDAKIVVRLGPEGEALRRYEIEYAEAPPTDAGQPAWRRGPDLEASKTSQSISGLTNGVTYNVRARSVDEVENVGEFNTPLAATPQASNGFWGEYKDAGGHELGGCSTADAAVPSLLGALGVLVALLRRRR